MKKRVIQLIRVSTEGQAASDRASIPAQRTINARTAAAYGLEIVRTIELSDVSGAAVLFAPEIQEMLRAIASPDIHGVVTREFSRLMRPERYSDYGILGVFEDTRTVLYLPDGPIDFNSRTGKLMGTIRAAMSGMERSEILERAWSAKEEKRRQGKFSQNKKVLPYGVGYEEERGFFYTQAAERVREVFKCVLAGNTNYSSFAKRLRVSPRGLVLILRNPIYTGWRVIDKKRDMTAPVRMRTKADGRQGDRPKIKRAEDEIIRVKVMDGIVSERDFSAVQRIMDVKQKRHWKHKENFIYRFTYNRFLTCGLCGQIVYTGLQRDDYYLCKNRKECKAHYMRRDVLDPQLDELFSSRLTDLSFIEFIASEYEKRVEGQTDARNLERLQARLVALQSQRARVLDAFYEGISDVRERDAKLSQIKTEMSFVQEAIMREQPPVGITPASLASLFAPLFEYKMLKREDKRRLLATIIPEIHVANYRVYALNISLPFVGIDTPTGMGSSRRRA